jgi:hypothetical protein
MYTLDKFYVSHFSSKFALKSILESYALQPLGLRREIFKQKHKDDKTSVWHDPLFYEFARDEGSTEKYDKSIFYSIIFPDNDGNPIFKPTQNDKVYFIFSPKIIEDNVTMLNTKNFTELPIFCSGWYYGKTPEEKCIVYDTSKSLTENLNNFRTIKNWAIDFYHKNGKQYLHNIMPLLSGTLRSELLMEGEMPLELDLVYIYVPKSKPVKYTQKMLKMFPDLLEVDKELELEELKLQKLIDENPHLPWIRKNPFV